MLLLLRFIFALISAPPVLLALVFFEAVDPAPLEKIEWQINDEDISNAKQIFDGSSVQNNIKTVELNYRDLNIALHYLLNNYLKSSSLVTLNNNSLDFKISFLLPQNLFGTYLNIRFNLTKQNGSAQVNSLKLGGMSIADELAGLLINKVIKYAHLKQHYILVTEQILDFEFNSDKVSLTYISDPEFTNNSVDLLQNAHDRKTLLFYRKKLTEIINAHDPEWRLSIAELLKPLFKIAHHRSTPETAVQENRLVIFAVNSYINKREILPYLPKNITAKPKRDYSVFMYKRIDMAKHFIASAALTTTGGAHLANIIGLEKELSDARGGSGFSFIDLAGDRAGMHFGQLATSSPENARKLQKRMAAIKDYTDFMPEVRDLPENMNRKAFKRKYGSVYTPQYQEILKEIDARIAALPLYQDYEK